MIELIHDFMIARYFAKRLWSGDRTVFWDMHGWISREGSDPIIDGVITFGLIS